MKNIYDAAPKAVIDICENTRRLVAVVPHRIFGDFTSCHAIARYVHARLGRRGVVVVDGTVMREWGHSWLRKGDWIIDPFPIRVAWGDGLVAPLLLYGGGAKYSPWDRVYEPGSLCSRQSFVDRQVKHLLSLDTGDSLIVAGKSRAGD